MTPDCTIQLAPFGTEGGYHLAFAMAPDEFDAAFGRIKTLGIEYGDSFHDVGNMRGPGIEAGARGDGPSVYVFDPNRHLVEIRTYDWPERQPQDLPRDDRPRPKLSPGRP